MKWRKASCSNNTGGNCVEVAPTGRTIAVRDSKHPDGPRLGFDRRAFTRFAHTLRR